MPKFPDISPHEYLQERGLRILAPDAFKFFYEHLDEDFGNYLEIGVWEGFMLKELALMYPDRMFYGIDPFREDGNTTGHNGVPKGEFMQDQCETTLRNIAGIKNIKFYQETSRLFSVRKTDKALKHMEVTSVLVDGDHSYEEAVNDLLLAQRLLAYGGVIYVDDADLPSVNKAIVEFGYKTEYRNGAAIIRI